MPKEVKQQLGLSAGSRVEFIPTEDGSYELVPATESITSLKGIIPAAAQPLTLADMDAAVAQAIVARLSS